jgi:hypothetical protein
VPVTVPPPFPLGTDPVPVAEALVPVVLPLAGAPVPRPALPLSPVPLPGVPVTVPSPFPSGTVPLPVAGFVPVGFKLESVVVVPPVLSVPALMLPVLSLMVLVVVSFAPLPHDANARIIALPKITFFILFFLVLVKMLLTIYQFPSSPFRRMYEKSEEKIVLYE